MHKIKVLKKSWFFLLIIVLSVSCVHNDKNLDLKKRIDALNQKAFEARMDNRKSIEMADSVLRLINDSLPDYYDGMSMAWNTLAYNYFTVFSLDSCDIYLSNVINLRGKYPNKLIEEDIATILKSKIIVNDKGLEEAFYYFQDNIKLFEEDKNIFSAIKHLFLKFKFTSIQKKRFYYANAEYILQLDYLKRAVYVDGKYLSSNQKGIIIDNIDVFEKNEIYWNRLLNLEYIYRYNHKDIFKNYNENDLNKFLSELKNRIIWSNNKQNSTLLHKTYFYDLFCSIILDYEDKIESNIIAKKEVTEIKQIISENLHLNDTIDDGSFAICLMKEAYFLSVSHNFSLSIQAKYAEREAFLLEYFNRENEAKFWIDKYYMLSSDLSLLRIQQAPSLDRDLSLLGEFVKSKNKKDIPSNFYYIQKESKIKTNTIINFSFLIILSIIFVLLAIIIYFYKIQKYNRDLRMLSKIGKEIITNYLIQNNDNIYDFIKTIREKSQTLGSIKKYKSCEIALYYQNEPNPMEIYGKDQIRHLNESELYACFSLGTDKVKNNVSYFSLKNRTNEHMGVLIFEIRSSNILSRMLKISILKRNSITTNLFKNIANYVEAALELQIMSRRLINENKLNQMGYVVRSISHEMATPNSSCKMETELIEEQLKIQQSKIANNDIDKKEVDKLVLDISESNRIIKSNVQQIERLIQRYKNIVNNDITDTKVKFNLKELVCDIMQSLEYRIKLKHITINTEHCADLSIFFYKGNIFQIMTNLITNSLIHGFKDLDSGEINIEADVINAHLVISYSDNGAGIAQADQKRIYDMFYTSNPSESSGLGLSIIKILVDNMKGSIELESDSGKGVRFCIQLPYPE